MDKLKQWGIKNIRTRFVFLSYSILGFVFAVILIILKIRFSKVDFGSVADWVSGLGSLGAIFTAFYQIEEQKRKYLLDKNQEREQKIITTLPYFNLSKGPVEEINGNISVQQSNTYFLDIASFNEKLPLEFLKIEAFWGGTVNGTGEKYNEKMEKTLNHIYPKENVCKLEKNFQYCGSYRICRLDLSCQTYNGIKIFFTCGMGLRGIHAYQDTAKEWHWYSRDGEDDIDEAKRRLKEMHI